MKTKINGVELSECTLQYIETAMWSSTVMLPCLEEDRVDGCMNVGYGHPLYGISEDDHLDEYFDFSDFTSESLQKFEDDCTAWFDYLEESGLYGEAAEYADNGHIAHDYWLTRNGHGAGYWDGDYGDLGDRLTNACKDHGQQHIWVDDGGQLHLEDG